MELLKNSARSVVNFPKDTVNTYNSMNLLGVKYVVHKISDTNKPWTFPIWKYEKSLDLKYDDGKFQIFENKLALPRTFIVGLYSVIQDDKEIINAIFNKNFNISKKIVLEKDPVVMQQATISAKADILNYSPNKVVISTKSDKDAILFLSDSYHSGWRGYVDGNEEEVLRAKLFI